MEIAAQPIWRKPSKAEAAPAFWQNGCRVTAVPKGLIRPIPIRNTVNAAEKQYTCSGAASRVAPPAKATAMPARAQRSAPKRCASLERVMNFQLKPAPEQRPVA